MKTTSHSARAGVARPLRLSLLAMLCAGLWCTAPRAAPESNLPRQSIPQAVPIPTANQAPTPVQGGRSSGSTAQRLAIGSVVAFGLWQAWRAQSAGTPAPAEAPAAPPLAIHDPDRPIPMDGITTVGQLDNYSIRQLMDTLRDLRANKQYDCDHGRTSQDFLCEKIRLVKAALGMNGVTYFGDESNDGCGCH